MTSEDLLDFVVETVLEKKGEDVAVIDLRDLDDAVADFFVIATGNSSVHVKAVADEVNHKLKKDYSLLPWHVEGMEAQKWILIDYVDVVLHVFDNETRNYYNLEKLWEDAEISVVEDDPDSAAS